MINFLTLPGKLAPYKVTDETQLPLDYRTGRRPLHDDWVVFKSVPRIKTAFRVPLPFRKIAGNGEPVLMPVMDDTYPILDGTPIEMKMGWDNILKKDRMMRHVWTMMSVHALDPNGPRSVWSRQEACLSGVWTESFYTRSVRVFGSKWMCYAGLKIDQDGPMAWMWEFSASIKWGHLG